MTPWHDTRNGVEIGILAMKRSGHHAIAHWLLCQIGGASVHLNNCEFVRRVQHTTPPPRVISRTDRDEAFSAMSSAVYLEGVFQGHIRHIAVHQAFSSQWERIKALQNVEAALRLAYRLGPRIDAYLFNLEDLHLDDFVSLPTRLVARGEPERRERVVVVRDLANWAASRIAGGYLIDEAVLRAWRSQVAAAARPEAHSGLVFANFPAWHTSPPYRRQLAERLGVAFTDAGREDVVPFGPVGRPGSSFDERGMHGTASRMDVLERWHATRDHAQWQSVMARSDLRALSAEVFGFDVEAG